MIRGGDKVELVKVFQLTGEVFDTVVVDDGLVGGNELEAFGDLLAFKGLVLTHVSTMDS